MSLTNKKVENLTLVFSSPLRKLIPGLNIYVFCVTKITIFITYLVKTPRVLSADILILVDKL